MTRPEVGESPAVVPVVPQLVALDIDGTIVDDDDWLSDRVRAAVQGTAESGRRVVLATGRSVVTTAPLFARLGLAYGYAVCSNGAVVLRVDADLPGGFEVVHSRTFDPGPPLRLLGEHLPDAVFAVEDVGRGYRVTAPFLDGVTAGVVTVVPFDELVTGATPRVMVSSRAHSEQEFVAVVDRYGLSGTVTTVGRTTWLDLLPVGVNKASGLQAVAAALGLTRAQTLAVGDGPNDIEMFVWAGRSVAMGQASAQVRACADEVCGDVTTDGLAEVLEAVIALVA